MQQLQALQCCWWPMRLEALLGRSLPWEGRGSWLWLLETWLLLLHSLLLQGRLQGRLEAPLLPLLLPLLLLLLPALCLQCCSQQQAQLPCARSWQRLQRGSAPVSPAQRPTWPSRACQSC